MSAPRPDPAPLTAAERYDAELGVGILERSDYAEEAKALRRLLAALGAAEARLADAALFIQRSAPHLDDAFWRAEARKLARALGAPRPTEETTP